MKKEHKEVIGLVVQVLVLILLVGVGLYAGYIQFLANYNLAFPKVAL